MSLFLSVPYIRGAWENKNTYWVGDSRAYIHFPRSPEPKRKDSPSVERGELRRGERGKQEGFSEKGADLNV